MITPLQQELRRQSSALAETWWWRRPEEEERNSCWKLWNKWCDSRCIVDNECGYNVVDDITIITCLWTRWAPCGRVGVDEPGLPASRPACACRVVVRPPSVLWPRPGWLRHVAVFAARWTSFSGVSARVSPWMTLRGRQLTGQWMRSGERNRDDGCVSSVVNSQAPESIAACCCVCCSVNFCHRCNARVSLGITLRGR